jgi:hypothetical protein
MGSKRLRLNVDLVNSPIGFQKSHITDDRGMIVPACRCDIQYRLQGGPMLVLYLPLWDHNVTITHQEPPHA